MTKNIEYILPPRMPIAIVRLDDLSDALDISKALLVGGITRVEFTLTSPQANNAITEARRTFGNELTVGAGTVLDAESAHASIDAGAQFLVTPALLPEVIATGIKREIPVVCGAFTPTEILAAWRAGASLVKVFPAGQLGAGYFKDVLAPLPSIPLVPTGGVSLETCADFLKAGAYTVAVGSQLVSKDTAHHKNWAELTERARRFMQACA